MREHFWGIRVKNHDFKPKNHIFSNFKGGGEERVPGAPNITCIFYHFKLFRKKEGVDEKRK
jgi:hypothetical protein